MYMYLQFICKFEIFKYLHQYMYYHCVSYISLLNI